MANNKNLTDTQQHALRRAFEIVRGYDDLELHLQTLLQGHMPANEMAGVATEYTNQLNYLANAAKE